MSIALHAYNSNDVRTTTERQHYKERYRLFETEAGIQRNLKDIRLRHFFRNNLLLSSIHKNTGVILSTESQGERVCGSYNDWRVIGRPPRIDINVDSDDITLDTRGKLFDSEIICRFVSDRVISTTDVMYDNNEFWFTYDSATKVDNLYYRREDMVTSFSYIPRDNNPRYGYHNPLNILVETLVNKIQISKIETTYLPPADSINSVSTVKVTTSAPHGLSVGMCATIYSKSVSDNRLFSINAGERYLGDFIVESVSSDTEFTYTTYHNPKYLKGNASTITSSQWNDLYLEIWELSPYSDPISSITYQNNSLQILLTAPSTDDGLFNFEVGDYVSITGTGTYDITNAKVIAVNQEADSITVEYFNSSSRAETITGGTLVYYPRLPSGNIPYNLPNTSYSPAPSVKHAEATTLLYATADSYADKNALGSQHGRDEELIAKPNSKYPMLYFPVPNTYEYVDNKDVIAEISIFGLRTEAGNASDRTITIGAAMTPTYTFNDTTVNPTSAALMEEIDPTHESVGKISSYDYGNYTQYYISMYNRFSINNNYIVNMLTGKQSSTVFLNIEKYTSSEAQNIYSSKESDEEWPYIVISSGVFKKTNPTINITDTYMYFVCNNITRLDDRTCKAVVYPEVFDSSSELYIRSKPFMEIGDEIEILNTINYNAENSIVANIVYDEDNEVFEIVFPHLYQGDEYSAIIRNKSRMISSYGVFNDAVSPNSNNIKVSPSVDVLNKIPYRQLNEFDIRHESSNVLSVSAICESGNESNTLYPIILNQINISDGRFGYVSGGTSIVVGGYNFDKLSAPSAILGDYVWEDGIANPVSVTLTSNGDDTYKFNYSSGLGLQSELDVSGLKNENGVTWFKISGCNFVQGDILTFIATGVYGASVDVAPAFPISENIDFMYGGNYYVVREDDGDDCWVCLTKKYVSRVSSDPYEIDVASCVALDDDEVAKINSLIEDNDVSPFKVYNPITSIEIADVNINTRNYKNRMYIQIDEYAPIIYIESETQTMGEEFDIYVSDLNGVDWSMTNPIQVEYMLGEGDKRFVKLTYKENTFGNKTYIYSDDAGNSSSITINIPDINSDIFIDLYNVKTLSNGDHVLTYMVYGDEGVLSNKIATTPGQSGVFSEGSVPGVSYGSISNMTSINTGKVYGVTRDYFYFDVTIKVLGDGIMKVYAGNNKDGDLHKFTTWYGPFAFDTYMQCIKAGDLIEFEGINLNEPTEVYVEDGKEVSRQYNLMVNNSSLFTINNTYENDASKISIKLSNAITGVRPFYVSWKPSDGGASIAPQAAYPINVAIVDKPNIKIENPYVEVLVNTEWVEPGDIIARDYAENDISDNIVIEGVVDTTTLGEYVLKYYAVDGCGQKTDTITRTVLVSTGCPVYITTGKSTYDINEDIDVLIDSTRGGLFNPNYLNNIVHFMVGESDIVVTIKSATPDRKKLVVKNPGIIASEIKIQVYTGDDNGEFLNCPWSNVTTISVASRHEPDKYLGKYKKDKTGANHIKSKYDNVNFNPIYNKDLAYSTFTITADENSLLQNVYTILLTNVGERLYNDEFGSNIESRLFDMIDDINGEDKILNECITLVAKYEPRVSIDPEFSYVVVDTDRNNISIHLYVMVPRGTARKIELTFRREG